MVVAPVARFRDIPFNSSIDIQALGNPEQLIAGFAPELYGGPLQEDDVLDVQVGRRAGLTCLGSFCWCGRGAAGPCLLGDRGGQARFRGVMQPVHGWVVGRWGRAGGPARDLGPSLEHHARLAGLVERLAGEVDAVPWAAAPHLSTAGIRLAA